MSPEQFSLLVEIIGYIASAFVLLSVMMRSIVKLRWYLLIGNIFYVIYGVMINAMPVMLLNAINGILNIYFLYQAHKQYGDFEIIHISPDENIVKYFINHFKNDIKKFFPDFENLRSDEDNYILMKDNAIVGLFSFKHVESDVDISIDYVTPTDRDLKPAKFLFYKSEFFKIDKTVFFESADFIIDKRMSKNLKLNFLYNYTVYNGDVIEGHNDGTFYIHCGVLDLNYKINKKNSIKVQLAHEYKKTRL